MERLEGGLEKLKNTASQVHLCTVITHVPNTLANYSWDFLYRKDSLNVATLVFSHSLVNKGILGAKVGSYT
jgi:hypothetical protein